MAQDQAPNPHFALKGDLTSGPVDRHLVRLTVPMVWGLLAIISFQLADMYFLSFLGTKPLVAVGFTIPVTMVVLSLIIAMGISTSSIVSRQIGQGNQDAVKRLATHALMITAMAGTAISVLGILFLDPIFRAMGADGGTLRLIRDFMVIYFSGTVFLALLMVGNAVLRASGDSLAPALILITSAVINVVLDPILIFGLLGFPRLEMKGAALANVLSGFCAMTVGLYILGARNGFIALAHLNFREFGDSLKRFAVIAIPVGIANTLQPFVSGVLIGLLAGTGHEAVAAYGIASRVEALAFVIIMALAVGMGPVIGQNWGARHFDRVNQTLKSAFRFVILWSIFVAVMLGLFAGTVAGLFTAEPGVARTAMLYFWIVPVSYAFGNLVNGWGSAFNAMGLPKKAFMLIVIRLFALTLPLAWAGVRFQGATGLFAGIAAANIISGFGSHFYGWRFCRKTETG